MNAVAAAVDVEELLEELAGRTRHVSAKTNFVWHRDDCPMQVLGIMADLAAQVGRDLPTVFFATHGGVHLAGIDDVSVTVRRREVLRLTLGRWMLIAW